MSLTTKGLDQSIREGWGHALLFYFDHPDGEVWGWSGAGDLVYDGNTYMGVGPFVSINGVGGQEQLNVREITFNLIGIPQLPDDEDEDPIRFSSGWLNKNITNRVGRVWLAGLDEGGSKVNGEAWLVAEGLGDYQILTPDDSRTFTLSVGATEPIFIMERAEDKRVSDQWLNDERGLGGPRLSAADLLPQMPSQIESWTRT